MTKFRSRAKMFERIVYSNGQLLIVGYTGATSTCQEVQYLNLVANTTGVHTGTIDCGQYENYEYPGMYSIKGGNVSVFGGNNANKSCIQQTTPGNDLGSKWDCLSSSESALEGLGYEWDGSGYKMRFSNFVL